MGTGKCRRWKHWLGAICLSILASAAAFGQTQGVSIRATNGVAYSGSGGTKIMDFSVGQALDHTGTIDFSWGSGFLAQGCQTGLSNSVALGNGNTLSNGIDFINGVNIDVNGTNRLIVGGSAGSNWVVIGNALGSNSLVVSALGYTGIGTNPIHQADVSYSTTNLSGNAQAGVPAMEVYKNSNGAGNTHEVLQLNATLADIPYLLLGNTGDGIDFSFQRNGVVGGDHLLISPEGNSRGIAVFGDGHVEIQNGSPGDLLAQSKVGIAGALDVGSTNVAGLANGQVNANGPLNITSGVSSFSGIASNKVATVGTYGVPTVFADTNINNATGSITQGGIGTAPNLAGHSTTAEFMGNVLVSSATTATLTVNFAWTDEGGTAQSTNIFPATTINANTDVSLGPLCITTSAGSVLKVSTTLTGTSTYTLNVVGIALSNN